MLQSIIRIMTQVVLRIPIQEMGVLQSGPIVETALKQGIAGFLLSKKNIMLLDYSCGLLIGILRTLTNNLISHQNHLGELLKSSGFADALASQILPSCGKMAEEDEIPGKFLSLMSEIVLAFAGFVLEAGSPQLL